jgi:hypothetical protein
MINMLLADQHGKEIIQPNQLHGWIVYTNSTINFFASHSGFNNLEILLWIAWLLSYYESYEE